ncbi:MAG: family NAD(P)-dependent oxidoreductase [Glaciihabitans sp.]|nr:family NAD(P)-dependent oxidoreductase [Glaciihabitans sp.]
MTWNPLELPRQDGRTFVVTGGARGIGYFVAEQLASTGARVVIAARSRERTDAAIASVQRFVPGARVEFLQLDLASLASVKKAAETIHTLGGIDGLVLNAGLTSGSRTRTETEDGLELLFGTNYLGHFALTAQSFDALQPRSRVVSLGSMSTRLAKARPDDLMGEEKYSLSLAYATSKHGMQTFGFELDRRLRGAGLPVASLVAHPGFALDGPAARRPGINDVSRAARFGQTLSRFMTQGKDRGAWPVVRALIDPDARGGEFYGPSRSVTGPPVAIQAVAQDYDLAFGRDLWARSEAWTGVTFDVS